MNRHLTTLVALMIVAAQAYGQAAMEQVGPTFQRTSKNMTGDVFAVTAGVLVNDKEAVLYVEDDLTPKLVRVDQQMNIAEEVSLKDHSFDGLLWTSITPFIADGDLRCLIASNTKKTTEFAIGQVDTRGALALNTLRRVASSEILFKNDPANTLPYRPQPDPILFSQGLQYALNERIVAAADGEHYLINTFTTNGKGNKRFWYSYLDKEFTELWSGTAELPYPDEPSRIHQISLANDGTIHLMTYVFPCGAEERKADKLCHEVHLTTLTDRGKTVSDVLVDKDFVSSARMCERAEGRVSMAIRYGSLTGQPGVVVTFDPADPKLKTTPVVDQRIPSIHKTKLMAYGAIETGAKKTTTSRNAKVPDEIVALLPGWNDGLVVVETFLETNYQIPMGDAIFIRRLAGDIRTSLIGTNDTIQWQHIAERAFMTTAGQSYDGVNVHLHDKGLTLLYDHTPRGLATIDRSGEVDAPEGEGKKGKKDKAMAPAESGVLRATTLDPRGNVVASGTALIHPDGLMPCPLGAVPGSDGTYIVKTFDRSTGYGFVRINALAVGE